MTMKNLLLIGIILFSFNNVNAQETSAPLADANVEEFIPTAPSLNHTWVKGHWQYDAGRYYWIDGAYVENVKDHAWVDGKWVKNQITDKWTYQDGFWNQQNEDIVYNGTTYKAGVITQGSVVELIQAQNFSLN